MRKGGEKIQNKKSFICVVHILKWQWHDMYELAVVPYCWGRPKKWWLIWRDEQVQVTGQALSTDLLGSSNSKIGSNLHDEYWSFQCKIHVTQNINILETFDCVYISYIQHPWSINFDANEVKKFDCWNSLRLSCKN